MSMAIGNGNDKWHNYWETLGNKKDWMKLNKKRGMQRKIPTMPSFSWKTPRVKTRQIDLMWTLYKICKNLFLKFCQQEVIETERTRLNFILVLKHVAGNFDQKLVLRHGSLRHCHAFFANYGSLVDNRIYLWWVRFKVGGNMSGEANKQTERCNVLTSVKQIYDISSPHPPH